MLQNLVEHEEDKLAALMATLQTRSDRREMPRFACSYNVEFDNLGVKGVVVDISRSGMRLELTQGNLATFADLNCWIWIDGSIVRIAGNVIRYVGGRQIAVRFHANPRSVGRNRLFTYVSGPEEIPGLDDLERIAATRFARPGQAAQPGHAAQRGQVARTEREALAYDSGFVVIDERVLPAVSRIAAQQAAIRQASMRVEAAKHARPPLAAKPEPQDDDSADAQRGPGAQKQAAAGTMARSRGASLMKFWIDRRTSSHY